MIRDGLLAQSGLLHKSRWGGSLPLRPQGFVQAHQPGRGSQRLLPEPLHFLETDRSVPVMMALDASKRDACTVPPGTDRLRLQALILLNGTQFVEAARATADKLIGNAWEEDPDKLATGGFSSVDKQGI